MDIKDLRGLMEAYQQVNAPEQLDEISQKTATRAYAASASGEFEGADSDRDLRRTDNLEKHIKRKFGDKAVKHAERAAEVQTFGRKDASGRSKQTAKPRIEKSDYRTTQDGKMHKQDQRELKRELRIKRDRRLRAEELDIFDVVLEFLQAEGYVETLEEAQWMMANVLDEETIDMIIGEGMTMKDFKKKRSALKQKEKRAADKIAPNRRKDIHTDRLSPERAARHRANVDPDFEGDDERNYPGGKLRAKKVRKAKALGELD